eukprot:13208-Hanusia_phi.AAC.1
MKEAISTCNDVKKRLRGADRRSSRDAPPLGDLQSHGHSHVPLQANKITKFRQCNGGIMCPDRATSDRTLLSGPGCRNRGCRATVQGLAPP